MIRFFVITFRRVAVKNGTAESRTFHTIAITTAGNVAACQDKFELARARLSEDSDRRGFFKTIAFTIMDYLIEDGLPVFIAVQAMENLPHQRLLVRREGVRHRMGDDHPVVIHLGAERILERKTDFFPLLLIEAPE